MKEAILRKENVFTCVTFGALFVFIVIESVLVPENLAITAFLVAISVFLLSLFKLPADVAEDISDKLTNFLERIERSSPINRTELWELGNKTPDCADDYIDSLVAEQGCQQWAADNLRSYYAARQARAKTRKIRRGFLYAYYFVFLVLLTLLLLHSELAPPCSRNRICRTR